MWPQPNQVVKVDWKRGNGAIAEYISWLVIVTIHNSDKLAP
jgi:hypothetical protein